MDSSTQNLATLTDIKKIMERSGRFISLSGWSGMAVGMVALFGAGTAWYRMKVYTNDFTADIYCPDCLKREMILIAAIVFIVAFVTATFFTYLKSKKEGVAIWGNSARRLLWNTMLPMIAGAFMVWRMMELSQYQLIAPASLIFYGLALVNGSKYTIGEVRYLGYTEIMVGIINLWLLQAALLCWATGFGVLHIIYGVTMWWKYDRISKNQANEMMS